MVIKKQISVDFTKYPNFLFIISAPSGCGKTTICKNLLKQHDDLTLSISATTRKPRSHEANGVDYFFLTKREFEEKISNNDFLEYAHVFNNYYGTPMQFVSNEIANKKNVLFDIDWQGARNIKSCQKFNVVTLFLLPPSVETLRSRLAARNETEEEIKIRIGGFYNDVKRAHEYDYILINENLDETCRKIDSIYDAEKIKFQKENMLLFIENYKKHKQ